MTITTQTALNAALAAAKSGAVLSLAAGKFTLNLSSHSWSIPVTITSADPRQPATITGGKITNTVGVRLTHLDFVFAPAATDTIANATYGLKVLGGADIGFDHCTVRGTPNSSRNVSGLFFKGVKRARVSNSELSWLRNCIGEGECEGFTADRNHFHDFRIDGIDNGAVTFVTITANLFENGHHLPGDHADAIQFSTANTDTPSAHITITGNCMRQGPGAVPFQGIFMTDQRGDMPFDDVVIANNLIIGGNWNGIVCTHVSGPTRIGGNTVAGIGWVDPASVTPADPDGKITTPWIKLPPGYMPPSPNVETTVTDGGTALLAGWKAAHP